MATPTKKRSKKNIFSDEAIKAAAAKQVYNRTDGHTLKIGGADKFLGLNKDGNPEMTSRFVPGFMYIPSYRVAGTQADFIALANKMETDNPGTFTAYGGPMGFVNTLVSQPAYTRETARLGGVNHNVFEREIDSTKRPAGSYAEKTKMSAAEAAPLFQKLVNAAKQGEQYKNYKFVLEKAAKEKKEKKPAAAKKRTGTRKGAKAKEAPAPVAMPPAGGSVVASPPGATPLSLPGAGVLSPGGALPPSGFITGLPPSTAL